MPLHAGSDLCFTAACTHGANEHGINESLEWMLVVFQFIPATLVKHLPQNLNRGLGTVLLDFRHIQVINKDYNLVSETSPEDTRAAFVEPSINDILHLIAGCLGGETDFNRLVRLIFVACVQLVHEDVLNVDRLSSTRRADKERGDLVVDTELLDVAVSHGVDRGDNNLLRLRVASEVIDFVFVYIGHPVLPLSTLNVIEVIVDQASIEFRWQDLLVAWEFREVFKATFQDFLKVHVNWTSELRVASDAERPDGGEEEHVVHLSSGRAFVQIFGETRIVEMLQKSAPEPEESLHDTLVIRGGRLSALATDIVDQGLYHNLNKLFNVQHLGILLLLFVVVEVRREGVLPGLIQGPPAYLSRLQVDHTASRYCGRRRLLQVHRLEHHIHVVRHLNDFSAHQAELLVVIEHGVHVLNPDGIDGSIEDKPALILVTHAVRHGTVEHRKNAILPIVGDFIILAVQLAHRDRLRVQLVDDRLALIHQASGVQVVLSSLEYLHAACFTGEGISDHHEAVTHDGHLVKLDDLVKEVGVGLQIHLLALFPHSAEKLLIVRFRQLDPGEQITRDVPVQAQIMLEELGVVNVVDSSEHEDLLVHIVVLALKVASGSEYRLDSSHTVIIMLLARELLRTKLVGRHNLCSQLFTKQETE